MIRPEQISDEVWHTAMSTYHKTVKKRPGSAWQEAIAAAINAWPGVDFRPTFGPSRIILPLPQEEGDA
jgi:hypothetical protein